jgi:hypothetical protein
MQVCQLSIKQTEIDLIHSLENFMYIFLLPTETVIVTHPVVCKTDNNALDKDAIYNHKFRKT